MGHKHYKSANVPLKYGAPVAHCVAEIFKGDLSGGDVYAWIGTALP